MNSQIDLENPQKTYLYLCDVDLESDLELFLKELQSFNKITPVFSFDRSLWANLSSGYIPPQLYDFSFNSGVNFLILSEEALDTEKLSSFRAFEVKLDDLSMSGKYEVSEFTEEDFQGGAYLTFIRASKPLQDVSGALKLKSMNDHLYLSEEMFSLDDFVQNNKESFELCQCFFMPSKEQFSELPELLKDKEKVHLNQNLTGIRC
ncbi:MAG: hypothetical protein NE334_03155 [Lentisphaeraceae bacterium]|nr:hypothetical protein [Lentisphaeraceae bacterium]